MLAPLLTTLNRKQSSSFVWLCRVKSLPVLPQCVSFDLISLWALVYWSYYSLCIWEKIHGKWDRKKNTNHRTWQHNIVMSRWSFVDQCWVILGSWSLLLTFLSSKCPECTTPTAQALPNARLFYWISTNMYSSNTGISCIRPCVLHSTVSAITYLSCLQFNCVQGICIPTR